MKTILTTTMIGVGNKIKLNGDGIRYLYDCGFKSVPEWLEVTDKQVEGEDVYFVTYETGDTIKLMIGEIAEVRVI